MIFWSETRDTINYFITSFLYLSICRKILLDIDVILCTVAFVGYVLYVNFTVRLSLPGPNTHWINPPFSTGRQFGLYFFVQSREHKIEYCRNKILQKYVIHTCFMSNFVIQTYLSMYHCIYFCLLLYIFRYSSVYIRSSLTLLPTCIH